MQLNSETTLKRPRHYIKRNLSRFVAYGLSSVVLALSSGISGAQELSLPTNQQPAVVTNATNYRSAEHRNQGPQLPSGNQIFDAQTTIDPATILLGDANQQSWWLEQDAWITDIGTLLFRDDDGDGYFSGFSFTIDADTRYQQTEVYVSIEIERTFGQRERLHTTANFSIYSDSRSDEYRIDIDLLTNYQAGDYDIYIDLHDAYDHRILDSVSGTDFSNLYRLPLESEDLDYLADNGYDTYPDSLLVPDNDDVNVVEYAGGSGFLILIAMFSSLIMRKSGIMRNPAFAGQTCTSR